MIVERGRAQGGEGPSLDADVGLHLPWPWSLSLSWSSVPPPAVNYESLKFVNRKRTEEGDFITRGDPEERSQPHASLRLLSMPGFWAQPH